MNYASGIFTSVFTLYTDINLSTLSGANDIIVVDNDGELKCTPFEIRFGKIDLFKIKACIVHLIVNDKLLDLVMTVGKNGDLYFITDKPELKINCYLETERDETLSDMDTIKVDPVEGKKLVSLERALANLENNFSVNLQERNENLYSEGFIQKSRSSNEEKRRFKLKPFILPNLSLKYKKFINLINSFEYLNYLTSNTKSIYHILRGSWVCSSNKSGECEIEGCKKSNIKFSLCGDKRTTESLENVFDGCEVIVPRDLQKLIVQISGCNNNYFYFEYSTFSELFFIVKNEIEKHFLKNNKNTNKNTNKRNNKNNNIKRINTTNPFIMKNLKNFYGLDFDSFLEEERINLLLEKMDLIDSEINSKIDLEILRKGLLDLTVILDNKKREKAPWSFFNTIPKKVNKFTTELNSEQLKSFNLKEGVNEIIFKISGMDKKLKANIYFWKRNSKIIISDIDGTITKSDLKGHFYNFLGSDWTHVGVAELYTKLADNGYKILYLTSRPLGQSRMTRYYLYNIKQNNFVLPDGPIIHSTSGLFGAIYRELIQRTPEKFKISCLKKIESIFSKSKPFIAGFGNKKNDVSTYKALKISSSKIFIINEEGNVYLDVTKGLRGTHFSLKFFVDSMFPKLKDDTFFDHSFTDAEFWKISYTK